MPELPQEQTGPVKFREKPGQDLQERTDFHFDLMTEAAKAAEAVLRASGIIEKHRDRARIEISTSPTLRNFTIDIFVRPIADVQLTEEERTAIKKEAHEAIASQFPERFNEILQKALTNARERVR